MSASSHDGDDRLIGQTIADRYQILEPLGEGGMGRVYLAEHVRMGRKSAIKVLSPNLALSPDAISRFNREAANASSINHPNVAQIYDFGETPDGLLYLAMEYVEGKTLRAIIAEHGPLPLGRAADITKQVADALGAAHHIGIVHRDLKPDNIMIARHHDGSDWVKVVDFGIAKTVQGSGETGGGSQTVTTAGVSLGTPEYMSPEQLAGERLDSRTDLYSLGLVLFNMLTADLPYPKVTSRETLVRRLTEHPRSLAEVAPDTEWPPELQAALDRALAAEARDRYATVGEFARDVVDAAASYVAHPSAPTQRIAVPGAPVGSGSSRPASRPKTRRIAAEAPGANRRALGIAGGLLVVLAVGAGAIVAARSRSAAKAVTKTSAAPAEPPAAAVAIAPAAAQPTPAPKVNPKPVVPPAPAPKVNPKPTAAVATAEKPSPDSSVAAPATEASPIARRHGGRFGSAWIRANGDTVRGPAAAPTTDADRVRLLVDEIRGHFARANQSLQQADVVRLRSELRDLGSDVKTLHELYPAAADSLHLYQLVNNARRRLAQQTCPAAVADSSKHFPPRFSCEQLLPNSGRGRQGGGQGTLMRPPVY